MNNEDELLNMTEDKCKKLADEKSKTRLNDHNQLYGPKSIDENINKKNLFLYRYYLNNDLFYYTISLIIILFLFIISLLFLFFPINHIDVTSIINVNFIMHYEDSSLSVFHFFGHKLNRNTRFDDFLLSYSLFFKKYAFLLSPKFLTFIAVGFTIFVLLNIVLLIYTFNNPHYKKYRKNFFIIYFVLIIFYIGFIKYFSSLNDPAVKALHCIGKIFLFLNNTHIAFICLIIVFIHFLLILKCKTKIVKIISFATTLVSCICLAFIYILSFIL